MKWSCDQWEPWARRGLPLALAALGLLLLPACASKVAVDTVGLREYLAWQHSVSALGQAPSESTRQILRQAGATPEQFLADERFRRFRGPIRLRERIAWAELAFLNAERLDRTRRGEEAAGWYYVACGHAWQALFSADAPQLDPRIEKARQIYNAGLIALLESWPRSPKGGYVDREITWSGISFQIPLLWTGETYPDDYFDDFLPAGRLRISGMTNHYREEGLGAALVGVRANRRELAEEQWYPPEGIARSLTAFLRFPVPAGATVHSGHFALDDERPGLLVHESRETCTVTLGDRLFSLEADFTAPYGWLLARSTLTARARAGFSSDVGFGEEPRLYLMEPYRPDRIPVIMVHGLLSSPFMWRELSNELWSEADLRPRYQVWHYFYPTSYPYLASSLRFRQELRRLRDFLRERNPGPGLDRVLILAHSMGGLVARPLVTDSGDVVWNSALRAPDTLLEGDPDDLARVEGYFRFGPEPGIERVVFIAVPHRGSDLAAGLVGKIGRSLIELPPSFLDPFRRVAAANPGRLSPFLERWSVEGRVDSVTVMRPDNPILGPLADLPFAPGVTVHTIVGDRGRGPGPEASDGVVSYASSRLPQAVSELSVPAGHDCFLHPWAVAEVKRILREHLAAAPASGLAAAAHRDDAPAR